jgi:hypothetical protein
MRKVTPAERREALKAFVEAPDDGLQTVDRSTLERALTCPWQAKAVESGRCRTVGILAEAGEAGHQAFSEALHGWIDSNGAISPSDLRMDVENAVRNARPDLQPEAVRSIQPAIYQWSQLIYSIHPGNILAFDGGEEIDRSGQLAIDFTDLGVRYTSELDLLYQGDCPEVLEEVDYKTGWKHHSAELIRDSFQFQSHAVLALEKYPDSKALRVRVFDTRHKSLSYPVYFERARIHDWKVRIRGAIDAWHLSQADNPPTWPTLEKCSICPAAALCPVADEPLADLARDPAGFVSKLVAVEARADAMKALAAKYVDETGRDIEAGTVRFGRQKPKAERKAAATLYSLKETA